MKVIEIKDIKRKDVPIYYRLYYTGVAVLELVKSQKSCRIDFSIEMKPTGQKEIALSFLDDLDYPLVPVSKEVRRIIDSMDSNGTLPVTD